MSWHSTLHNLFGTIVFVSMIVCCFVLARGFTAPRRLLGRIAGTVFAVLLVWTYTGGALGGLALFAGVVVAWSYVSWSLAHLARTSAQPRN